MFTLKYFENQKCVFKNLKSIIHHFLSTFISENIIFWFNDVAASNFSCDNENPDTNYDNLVTTFSAIIDKHAPIKQNVLRGNDAPFMNKELRKAIYHRSKLKNYYNKNRTEESKLNYKKQRNKCVKLRKKAIKLYFKTITNPGFVGKKKNVLENCKTFYI